MSPIHLPWKEETKYEEQAFYDNLFSGYTMEETRWMFYKHDFFFLILFAAGFAIFVATGLTLHNFWVSLLSGFSIPTIFYLALRDHMHGRSQNMWLYEVCFTPINTIHILEHELIVPPIPLIGLSETEQEEIEEITRNAVELGEPQDYTKLIEKIVGESVIRRLEQVEEKKRKREERRKK